VSAVDCVYIAVSARDTRLARIAVASVRYFHPGIAISLLPGAPLARAFVDEMRRGWGVGVAGVPRGVYGWGFVKLEPLFGRAGERFLVLDADTVLTGPVLDVAVRARAPFVVDDTPLPDAQARQLYFDWDRVRALDPGAPDARAAFNSGQWIGTAGLVPREAFDPWVEFGFPRRLRHPALFMGGDQGVLNLVLLGMEARGEIAIDRVPLMRWAGHPLDGLTAEAVAARRAPAAVIHWAGEKRTRLGNAAGADVLRFFERAYYAGIGASRARRAADAARHVLTQWHHAASERVTLVRRRMRGGPA
jgi:hypothetical protein